MREKIKPWMPAIFCSALSLITVVSDIVGRFMTGQANVGLTVFLCFLPMCFLFVGVMLKNLHDENRMLKMRLDEQLNDNRRKSVA